MSVVTNPGNSQAHNERFAINATDRRFDAHIAFMKVRDILSKHGSAP